MNAKERYLAVFDDNMRGKLDRVPTHVQYIKDEFVEKHEGALLKTFQGELLNNSYFDIPRILGFDAIFAPFPTSYQFKPVRIEDDDGNKVRIGINGQAKRRTTYYEGGYIHSIDILEKITANFKKIDRSKQIKKLLKFYEGISSAIYPVLMVDGIFDRAWQSMGLNAFSRVFRKKTRLYRKLIEFFAEITRINIEGLIDASIETGLVVNILDDVAFKGRSMISPERWNQDFLPYYKEINSIISDAGLIPQIHTDGDVTELIPSFQDAGFRGLQGWEGGCDPAYINDHFPDFVVIGFGDVSNILPYGTTDQVEDHVKTLMDVLKENRRFILGPSTVIFKEIPLKNVRAFMNAANKFGKY